MSGIRRSMNLPDWHMLAPLNNFNPYDDVVAPCAAQESAAPAGAAAASVTSSRRQQGGTASSKHACWRWHLDYADPETGQWRCLLSDRDLFVALRSMLRRTTRGPPAAPMRLEGRVPPPEVDADVSTSRSAACASASVAMPSTADDASTCPEVLDARLRRSRTRAGLDLRLRVVVGQRCIVPESLPLPVTTTGMGKVVTAFLNATAPTIPSHMPATTSLSGAAPLGPGIRRVFLPSPAAEAKARASAPSSVHGGAASADEQYVPLVPADDDFLSPEVLLIPASKLLDKASVSCR